MPIGRVGLAQPHPTAKNTIRLALIVTIVSLVVWAVASHEAVLLIQSRLYFAMFPAWAVLGGIGLSAFDTLNVQGVRFGRLAAVLVVLVLGFSAFETGLKAQRLSAPKVILGQFIRG